MAKSPYWKAGRGFLGSLSPLLGEWTAQGAMNGQAYECRRSYAPFGKRWVRLFAEWTFPTRAYREIALIGRADDGRLGFFSFTDDGKRSVGHQADGSDVHSEALAFEAQMPAGVARMIYWPHESLAGFNFAVEGRKREGWNRFLHHVYLPSAAKPAEGSE